MGQHERPLPVALGVLLKSPYVAAGKITEDALAHKVTAMKDTVRRTEKRLTTESIIEQAYSSDSPEISPSPSLPKRGIPPTIFLSLKYHFNLYRNRGMRK